MLPPPAPTRRGQSPTQYKATFRRFTRLLRASTRYATTLWAPNEGGGYPFGGEARAVVWLCCAAVLLLLPRCCHTP